MKHNLLKYGIIGASLACSTAMVLGNVGNFAPTKAAADNTVLDGDFYKVSYGTEGIKLLLSADVSDYSNLRASDLGDLKDDFITAVGETIATQLDTLEPKENPILESLMTVEWSPKITHVYNAHAPAANCVAFTNLMVGLSSTNGVLDIDKWNAILDDVDGTYANFFNYMVGVYTGNTQNSVARDFIDMLMDVAAFGDFDTGILDLNGSVLSPSEYLVTTLKPYWTPATETKPRTATLEQLTAYAALIEAAKEGNSLLTNEMVINPISSDCTDGIKDTVVGGEADELKELLTAVSPDLIAEIIEKVELEKDDINQVLNTVGIKDLLAIASEIDVDGIETILSSVIGYTAGDFKQYLRDNYTELNIVDFFKAIKSIEVDGNVVMANKQFQKAGIVDLLRGLPKLSEIATWGDDDMKITWNISVETVIGYAVTDFTVGLYGDCTLIRRAAQALADAVDVSLSDGTIKVAVKAPDRLAKLLKYAANTTAIPDSLKYKFFKFMNSTVEDMYNEISNLVLADLVADLQSIDYEKVVGTLMSADKLNEIFSTNKFTDERIDKLVNEFMKLLELRNKISFDKVMDFIGQFIDISAEKQEKLEEIYNKVVELLDKIADKGIDAELLRKFCDPNDDTYSNQNVYDLIERLNGHDGIFTKVQNIVEKIYNALPANWHDKKIMNAYKGNGQFAWAGTLNFNIENLLTELAGSTGETIADGLEAIMGELPSSINLDLSFKANDIYSVTYVYADGSKLVGALPVGANIAPFGGAVQNADGLDILGWLDADGNVVTVMPAADITVYARYDFRVERSADIVKLYDFVAEEISVNVVGEGTFSYQWYRDGELMEGATTNALPITGVPNNGMYYCEVTRAEDSLMHASDEIKVKIDYLTIDVSGVKWDYEDAFAYDGESHKVSIDPLTLPEHVSVLYSDIREAKDAGVYQAAAWLYCEEPTVDQSVILDGETWLNLTWEIKPVEIDLPNGISWDYEEPFVYDGTAKSVNVNDFSLPEHVVIESISGNTATNAGTYQAVVKLTTDSRNYVLVGETEYTVEWKILARKIDLTADDVAWGEDTFEYDGDIKTVELADFDEMNYVDIAYAGNSGINAGNYTASAIISIKDTVNYIFNDGTSTSFTVTHDWTITTKEIVIDNIDWDYVGPFVYDAGKHEVRLAGELPEHVIVDYDGVITATNAGDYVATATLYADSVNVTLVGNTFYSLSWKVLQAEIDVSGVKWNYTSPYEYTGLNFVVELDETTIPDYVSYAYAGTTCAANVGTYLAGAQLVAIDANYVLVGETMLILHWQISPAKIVVDNSMITWNYTSAYTYDGAVRTVEINTLFLDPHIVIVYSGDYQKANAGVYQAMATLLTDSSNYIIVGKVNWTLDWEIKARQINVAYVTWNYTYEYTYDGTNRQVRILAASLPTHVQVSYEGTINAINAGVYNCKATLSADSYNYVLVGETVRELTWKINKAQLDLAAAHWNYYVPIACDGAEHTVSIVNYDTQKVVVTYEGTRTATAYGTYTVTAKFALASAYANNYELVNAEDRTLTWVIDKSLSGEALYESVEKVGDKALGKVTTKAELAEGVVLHVEELDAKELKGAKWASVFGSGKGVTIFGYYNVYFADAAGNKVNLPEGEKVKVEIMLSEEAAAREGNYQLVAVGAENELTKIRANKKGDYMAFETNLLGNFAIVEVGTTSVPWWILAIIIAAGAVIAVETYVIIVKKKKKAQ